MQFTSFALAVAVHTMAALAYSNNCKGSVAGCLNECKTDCYRGLSSIDHSREYPDQTQFSTGHCYIKYATNGAGDQPVSGKIISDVADQIIRECAASYGPQQPGGVGSYGTGNCASCHVTVNYRA